MKLLWIGDAVVPTGFSRVTHNILEHLRHKWDVHVLGVNYDGDPSPYQSQYKLYPAMLGGDVWGLGRLEELVRGIKPDVICINNDPWNVVRYLGQIPNNFPTVAYMPVDAPNQGSARELSVLSRAITYTNFGRKELMLGGFNGKCEVIPHGVDTTLFHPVDQLECRRHLNTPTPMTEEQLKSMFIVGCVNRNQPRKRLDLVIQYFTQFWYNIGQPSHVYLYFHTANRDQGWNVVQLAEYYGIRNQIMFTNPRMSMRTGLKETDLKYIYGIHDVHLSCTMGEGWGLTQHESMAGRIAQVAPRYSALAEWCKDAVRFVECTSWAATPNGVNTIGGIPGMQETVEALTELYQNPERRAEIAEAGYRRATEERFQWSKIADQFHLVLLDAATERRQAPVGVEAPKHGQVQSIAR